MKLIPTAVTRSIGTKILQTKMASPHIFFGLGVAGVIGGTVLACRATLKLDEVLDDFDNDIEQVRESKEVQVARGNFDRSEYNKDLAYVYGKAAGRVARLYALPVSVQLLAIGALTGSHVQLTRRNTALTLALGTVTKAMDEYRERVRAEIGEERERDLYLDLENRVIENDDGSKELVKIMDPNNYSTYARMFDEYNPNWSKDPELNRLFVQCQQNFANDKLQSRGWILLNEVYDSLGIEQSSAGAVVGWFIDDDESTNHVDFGMFDAYNREFINGGEPSIVLDFNVQGVIYDKIGG